MVKYVVSVRYWIGVKRTVTAKTPKQAAVIYTQQELSPYGIRYLTVERVSAPYHAWYCSVKDGKVGPLKKRQETRVGL